MKKIIPLLFICIFTALGVTAKLYSSPQAINVRKGAGSKYPVITTIKKGENTVVTDINDGWGKVTVDEKDGYVLMKLLTEVGEDASAAPAATTEQPDTDDHLDNKTLLQVGVVILVLLGLQQYHNFRERRKSKATTATGDKPKHKAVYWFYCKSCLQKVNSDKQPTNHYCHKAEDHTWINLGEAGKINYACKDCGITVRTKKQPNTRECPSAAMHTWTDLGEFGEKNYYCKNCGISVLVAKPPTTENCGKAEAHAWTLMK
jgi:hypothetical protein